jgi:serine/threonine protein kinase
MNATEQRVEAIFDRALELSNRSARDAFVRAECGDDLAVEARVRRLLEMHDEAGGFLKDTPVSPEVEAELARLKPEEAGERIGPYKLRELIGEGGFGTVWVADQETPVKRRVALKVIKLGMDTKEVIARFEQERQALAMKDHPNIARVLDAGSTCFGRPFFVMELVRGIKITDYCDQANLSTRERLELFVQICHGIQHAHHKGIIHRDLKPSNILVTLHDGVAVPKVIDFGVAKATQSRLTDLTIYTQFQQMIGTPLYMSPEQAEMSGLDVDTRSDIYSLGVLLYELLVGRTPFDPEKLLKCGQDEMRRVIREQDPPKPSTALSTMAAEVRTVVALHRHADAAKMAMLLRGDLDWIVMKALDKDRTRRYQTANDLALDIGRFLANETVSAAAPSAMYRFNKFARRNKTALGVAAVIAAVLVLATLVSTWQAIRAPRAVVEVGAERDAKDRARQEAEAVSAFLTEVFQSPDPARDGRTITVAETLDRASRKLDADLGSQPARRVKLQETLGWTYHALGLDHDALPLLEKARAYYVATLGPAHADTISAMHNLALAYRSTGRRAEALKLLQEVLALRRKALGPEHRDTLLAMHNLAVSYFAAGRWDEAIALGKDVLAARRKVLGPEHPDTMRTMHNLAYFCGDAGRLNEALPMQEEVTALSRKLLGPEHPDTLATMHNLAFCYRVTGRPDDGLKLAEEVLRLDRQVLGPEHPHTRSTIGLVALFYLETSRVDEAIRMNEEVLGLLRKRGPEHPETVEAMGNLAMSYHAAGRRAEALKLRAEVLALSRRVTGPEHPDTLGAMALLAVSYHDTGRWTEALTAREEVLALYRKVKGPEHPDTLSAMARLAESYSAAGRHDEAEKLAREALAARKRRLGSEHPAVAESLSGLSAIAAKHGDLTAAAAFEVDALTILKKVLGSEHPNVAVSLDHHGRYARERGDFSAAEEPLLEAWRIVQPPRSPNAAKVREILKDLWGLYAAWTKTDNRKAALAEEWKQRLAAFDDAHRELRE